MHKRLEIVEKHISDAEAHQADGDFRSALRAAREALSAMEGVKAAFELEARALLLAARNAYYISAFDECSIYLDMLNELTGGVAADAECERYEASIIRANVLRRKGDYQAALEELTDIDESLEDCLSGSLAGERFLIEGACHFYLRDTVKAREVLETALGLAAGGTNWKLKARILTMMGLVLRRLGFMKEAADDLRRAAASCSKHNDEYGLAAALLNLGITHYHEGDLDGAERSFVKASSLFERVGWELGRCRCLIALGNASTRKAVLDEAQEYYSDASRIARDRQFRREIALALGGLAAVHTLRKDFLRSKNCLEEAIATASEIAPDGDLTAEILIRRGEMETEEGDCRAAIKSLRKAERICADIDAPVELGRVYRAIGVAEAHRGNLKAGVLLFESARDVFRRSGSLFELALTCLVHAETIMLSSGRYDCLPDEEGVTITGPWSLLWEARHLFSGMKADKYIERVDDLLRKVDRKSQVNAPHLTVKTSGSHLVAMGFDRDYKICDGLVAVSYAMKEVWNRVLFAADYDGPVLVTGETGTGKELVARLIHGSSGRSAGPFVAVNCAAIPDHLFESEFFGHRKGCFTGATADRKGFFEEASGGTLFLDEVGELSPLHQAKLLRVLQEGSIRRLGENNERPVDIKLISATNKDLGSKLEDASLREDFFFRINSERIHIPPLRDRREDIMPLMVWRLCGNGNGGDQAKTVKIEQKVMSLFQRYHWPGNVRELISIADRLCRLADGCPITFELLPESMRGGSTKITGVDSGSNEICGRSRLEHAMNTCGGNKSAAARWLGISRGKLYKELERTGLGRYYRRGKF